MTRYISSLRVASLITAAALGIAACQKGAAEEQDGEAPAATVVGRENVAVAANDEIRSGPVVSGALTAEREGEIRAQVGGPVLQVFVEQGERVRAGQQMARIDDAALRDAFLSARSGMTAARSAYDLAEREGERAARLLEAGAIAERDVEGARSALDAARSRLADARARLTLAQEQLDDAHVRAPFDGVVAQRQVSAGDIVSPGAAMFTVIDPGSMQLEASVPADQLSSVRQGSPVTFSVRGYADRSFTGRVTRVSPAADPVTRQVRIIVSIPNTGRALVAGLFAEGRVTSESHMGTVVPAAALDQRGVAPVVVRVKNGAVERVPVEIGLTDPTTERVEILRGIAAGDTVLVGAATALSAGTRVRVSDPADAPARAGGR